MLKVGVIASNYVKISKHVKKGTEVFIYALANQLKTKKELRFVCFCSGDSDLPNKKSFLEKASLENEVIDQKNHALFERIHIAKALALQNGFDLYHINIGNGEVVLPFLSLIKKPVIITLHSPLNKSYYEYFYGFFKSLKHVHFISISDSQRKPLPNLAYQKTIYNGINLNTFQFNSKAEDFIIWAGRGVPEKGLYDVLQVIKKTEQPAKLYPILRKEHFPWFKKTIIRKRNEIKHRTRINMDLDINRTELGRYMGRAKLFLNPIKWEEPFGLVMIEAMACGTPIVAYARGSVPEIIKDGRTGFIINPSKKDKRGNWIIKKIGVEGLVEAVNRIYNMPKKEYQQMRLNCRQHVEMRFTVERMVKEYIEVYKEIIAKSR